MRLRRLGLHLFVVGLAILSGVAAGQGRVLINIDKTTQRMTVTVDGVQRFGWPVSTGGPGYDTPSGEFTPFRMEKDHFSREWDDAPMPNSIFFTKIGHAIHGTFATKNLGRPVSHGCVRLSPANAETLFALVRQEGVTNTRVTLNGHIPSYAATPSVPSRKPLDLNASAYEERMRARNGQRLDDLDSDERDTVNTERDFRDPDYQSYREPRRRYHRDDLPLPFPFLFGQ
jgi:hypothetical protein